MDNFNYWKNEIADMPEQRNGVWIDLETGLEFDGSAHYKTGGTISRWGPSDNVKGYRKVAKFYGAKALTGTAKQKEWGEKLRYEVLTSDLLSDEQKSELLSLEGVTKTAAFWINNRSLKTDSLTKEFLLGEDSKIRKIIDENMDGLYSRSVTEIELAKKAIYEGLKAMKINMKYDFHRADELYSTGADLREFKWCPVRGKLDEVKQSYKSRWA